MARPRKIVSTESLEDKDREAAQETIEHLTAQEPPAVTELPPIEPIDQSQPPAPPVTGPVEIVDLDAELEKPQHGPSTPATKFFCGEIGLIRFEDHTHYLVKNHHFATSDPKLIANLKEATKNPSNKLFLNTD